MNKKLLAVAVAGALAAPGLALAQSSVTISGVFKISLDNVRINSPAASRAGQNTNETRVADDSSRIIFNVTEDLGGGLAAIMQLDVRVPLDTGGAGGVFAGNGNTWVGLKSKSLGSLTLGRNDLHYFGRESNLTVRGSLKGDSISLLSYMQDGTAIAGATRTNNVVKYTTPDFSGFSAVVAYSTNPQAAAESDLGTGTSSTATFSNTQRKGNAWNIAPTYEAQNWTAGWSHWESKPDTGGAALATGVAPGGTNANSNADQKADRLFGSYRWGGFHVGLAWDKSRLRASTNGSPIAEITGALTVTPGTILGNRTAWSLPIEYKWGNHSVMGHYTVARDDKATTTQDGAKMFAISYAYDLSKRTSVALTYGKITNDVGAQYNFFTTQGALGSTGANVNAGEDPRFIAATMRHAF